MKQVLGCPKNENRKYANKHMGANNIRHSRKLCLKKNAIVGLENLFAMRLTGRV